MTKPQEIAPDVWYLGFNGANVYLIGTKESWIVVDTGVPGHATKIREAGEAVFGADAKPAGIVLTHAHLDHFGSAKPLLEYWQDVPVYAHLLDKPYLTGQDKTAPGDPSVGGFFAQVFRTFPQRQGVDLSAWFRVLPETELVPGITGWRWFHTPGHTPGHISLWREADRTLIAGDALTTIDLDSMSAMLSKEQKVSRPPSPVTSDWGAARESVQLLSVLHPQTLGAGHGIPMHGDAAAHGLTELAASFEAPAHGRYIPNPAVADESGVKYIPPPAMDWIGLGIVSVIVGGGAALLARRLRTNA